MKRIQLYTTGSFFLMTLSAAAETWFAGVSNHHSLFLPCHDLLSIIFPKAMNKLEVFGFEHVPIFWGFLVSTVLQLPLWSIFAITSTGFSYLLLTDPTEIKRYGKNSEKLEMWVKASLQQERLMSENKDWQTQGANSKSIKSAYVDPDIWCPNSLSDDKLTEQRDSRIPNEYKLSEFVHRDGEFVREYRRGASKANAKSAYADPDIWLPALPSDYGDTNANGNRNEHKDEIYEFDEFCEFLDYTESKFDDGQFDSKWLLESSKKNN